MFWCWCVWRRVGVNSVNIHTPNELAIQAAACVQPSLQPDRSGLQFSHNTALTIAGYGS